MRYKEQQTSNKKQTWSSILSKHLLHVYIYSRVYSSRKSMYIFYESPNGYLRGQAPYLFIELEPHNISLRFDLLIFIVNLIIVTMSVMAEQ